MARKLLILASREPIPDRLLELASSFGSTGKPGSYRSTFSWVETKLWKTSLMTTSNGAASYPSRSGWKEIAISRTLLRSRRN